VCVDKRSKVDLSIVYETHPSGVEALANKSIVKIKKALDDAAAHPDPEKEDVINDVAGAVHLSNFFLEHATLGAMVDLLARDTFRGLNLSVFSVPTKFPLYLATCVFLAAFPEIARLPASTGACHAEDAANCAVLIEMFRSVTVGVDRATRQRTSAFEAILSVACDGCGLVTQRKPSKVSNGRVKSVYVKPKCVDASSAEASHVPFAIEAMRRKGAALMQELFGHHTDSFHGWAWRKHADELGKDTTAAAVDTVYDPVWRASLADRRAYGSTGSSAQAGARSMRLSRLEAMQRVVLEILVEVNQFCSDGTYRMCRFASQNSAADDAAHGADSGIQRNVNACRVVHHELVNFFNTGVSALITDGIPRVMPIRPQTRVKCGDCGEDFDPLDIAPRDVCALCEDCNVLFCIKCYKKRVKLLIAKNGGNTLTAEFLCDNEHWSHCPKCAKAC
jgi:hypothetical protein